MAVFVKLIRLLSHRSFIDKSMIMRKSLKIKFLWSPQWHSISYKNYYSQKICTLDRFIALQTFIVILICLSYGPIQYIHINQSNKEKIMYLTSSCSQQDEPIDSGPKVKGQGPRFPYRVSEELSSVEKEIDNHHYKRQFKGSWKATLTNQQFHFQHNMLKQLLMDLVKEKDKDTGTFKLIQLVLEREQTKYIWPKLSPEERKLFKQNDLKGILEDGDKMIKGRFDQMTKKSIEVKSFIDQIRKNDVGYLFTKQEQLEKQIAEIICSRNLSFPIYGAVFKDLLLFIERKIISTSMSRIIFPALHRVRQRLYSLLNIRVHTQGSKIEPKIQRHLTDIIYQRYATQKGEIIPISKLIAACNGYFEPESGWPAIFLMVTQQLIKQGLPLNQEIKEIMDYFKRPLPIQRCLGCSQMFYAGHNIYYPRACSHTVALLGKISQMKRNSKRIKSEICGLLNGNGGVLLFDCSQMQNTIKPHGCWITEEEKIKIKQRVERYIEKIFPKVKINKNIFIKFVPLVEDPLSFAFDQMNPNYIKGMFVTTITVKPICGHEVHYWSDSDGSPNFNIRTESLTEKGLRQVKGKDITRLIKRKWTLFRNQLKEQTCKIEQNSFCDINHKCQFPEVGIRVYEKKKEEYRYASLVVAKMYECKAIKKNLLEEGIDCSVDYLFQGMYGSKAQPAILYHDIPFDTSEFKRKASKLFEIGRQKIHITPILQHILLGQITEYLKANLERLEQMMKIHYPNETLKLWKFITDDNCQELYIQTESKESTFFMALLVKRLLIGIPILMNPPELEVMSEQEIMRRYTRYVPQRE